MDILQEMEHFFIKVLPVATPIIVAWISYRFPKKAKEQTDQIISELSEVKKQIKDVQETADDNNTKIDQVQAKLKLHDDAHLGRRRMRLDRDIRRALRRGYTTRDEFYGVDSMRISYKSLGGNNYIDHLYDDFKQLEIREGIIGDEKEVQNGP